MFLYRDVWIPVLNSDLIVIILTVYTLCMCEIFFLFLKCPLFQRVPRTGWVYRNIKQPESVSDHMYRMAMMALTLQDPSINREK